MNNSAAQILKFINNMLILYKRESYICPLFISFNQKKHIKDKTLREMVPCRAWVRKG